MMQVQINPRTTVARRLASLSSSFTVGSPFGSGYCSSLNELLFQPQVWLMEKWSGELEKRVNDDPVAEGHEMVKYAMIDGRGSRYGCTGAVDTGVTLLVASDVVDGWKWDRFGGEGDPGTAKAILETEPDEPVDMCPRGVGDCGAESWAVPPGGEREMGLEFKRRSACVDTDIGGADARGMGSTLDWRRRYTPSWMPFLRTTCTYTLNSDPAYQIVCE